jgi:hypothetical protein
MGRVEDKDRSSPTWDGRVLHIARLRLDWHVLHEVGHWICAKPEHRVLPNYGLGTDPDGGPSTKLFVEADLKAGRLDAIGRELLTLAKTRPDLLLDILKAKLSREEEVAALVSLILTHRAGGPWKQEMNRVYRVHEVNEVVYAARFWEIVEDAAERDIDLEDPLRPFARERRRP